MLYQPELTAHRRVRRQSFTGNPEHWKLSRRTTCLRTCDVARLINNFSTAPQPDLQSISRRPAPCARCTLVDVGRLRAGILQDSPGTPSFGLTGYMRARARSENPTFWRIGSVSPNPPATSGHAPPAFDAAGKKSEGFRAIFRRHPCSFQPGSWEPIACSRASRSVAFVVSV